MSRDHIIPQFILRGFAINPNASKQKQKINIYDTATKSVKTKNIADAYQIENFNSNETEKLLAHDYEQKVARIFERIKNNVRNGNTTTSLTNNEYKLLFRFFVVMWRRNDIQMENAKKMCNDMHNTLKIIFGNQFDNMLNPEYKNINVEEYFDKSINDLSKDMYDKFISETTINDPTVQKTIKHYYPTIINNKTDINFILHNTYGTINYVVKNGSTPNFSDVPAFFIEPISSKLTFLLLPSEKEINIEQNSFEIPIVNFDVKNDIEEIFINQYMTSKAKSYVVDDTNIQFLKEKYGE